MVFLKRVSARVGHEEMAFVIGDSLWLVSDLAGRDDLKCLNVYLSHIAPRKCVKAMDGAALMPIGGHIHISSVCGELAVVGHVLRLCHALSVGRYELDDVAPVDGDCNQAVVDLDDVVRGITQLPLIDIPEPLVADHLAVFKIGDFAIVGLPVSFVQQDDALLAAHRGGDGTDE